MTSPVPSAHRRFKHIVFDPRGRRGLVVDFSATPKPRARNLGHSPFAPLLSVAHPPTIRLGEGGMQADEESFVLWLFEQAGVEGGSFRPETLRRRMSACLRALRAHNIDHARSLITRQPQLVQVAVGAILIGVTSFFRDADVFDHLTYSALSSLSRPASPRRVWSVGCSDGAELYSVAIILAEMELLDGSLLLGTDCRSDAIKAAREGCYIASAMKGVPLPWQEKYFIEHANRWQLRERVRSATQWRRGDATQVQEPGAWDIILCRNMAMYFRPKVANRLWEQLELCLRPGGFLVLGKAERPIGASRLSLVAPCIYRRDRG